MTRSVGGMGSVLHNGHVFYVCTLRTLTIGENITVRLTSCLTGLDLAKQVKLLFLNLRKAAESNQNKHGVSCTMILPPMVSVYL